MKKEILFIVLVLLIISILGIVNAADWAGESGTPIYQGWNLVYGFMSPNQLSGSHLISNDIKAVYAFNPITQEYLRAYPNPDTNAWQNLDSVIDDHELAQTAFWVYSDKTVPDSLNGHEHYEEYWIKDTPVSYSDRPLYKGWNFFGITPDIVGININDMKGNCNIEKIYVWEADSQQWGTSLNAAVVGTGALIKVTNNCKLGEVTAPVSPPPTIPNN
jgi:hypothetical protein